MLLFPSITYKRALKKTDDAGDVAWIETCVVKYFCLQPLPGQGPKMFKKPQFEEEMKNFVPGDYFEVILRVLRW